MESNAMAKPTIFISYSHEDEAWKDRLVTHLGVLQREGLLNWWDDRRIGAGEGWYQEIQEAMDAASVAILIVSADFLTSNFILSEEVPRLLERRDEEGMRIFPVIIKPCAWDEVKWLARMQVRPRDGEPLSAGNDHQIDVNLVAIAKEIAGIIEGESPKTDEHEKIKDVDSESATLSTSIGKFAGEFFKTLITEKKETDQYQLPKTRAPPLLDQVMPGSWQLQLVYPNGMTGQSALEMNRNGAFSAQGGSSMGTFSIDGTWQVVQSNKLQFNGMLSDGYQMTPFNVIIQFSQITSNALAGVMSTGEQVTFQRVR